MPSPKDGTLGTLVPPTEPDEAIDADNADPGQVETVKANQRASQTGKYGAQPITPFHKDPPSSDQQNQKKKSWIALILHDTDGHPVPGEPYQVTLPDGRIASGTTGADGKGRVDGFDPGQCKIHFPNLDKSVLKPS